MRKSFTNWLLDKISNTAGASVASVAKDAGLDDSTIRRMIERDASPRLDNAIKICDALGTSLEEYFGAVSNEARLKILVVGKVGAGAKVPLISEEESGGLYSVTCPAPLVPVKELAAVEIEGNSMLPNYQSGDLLFYKRETIGVPTEAIGVKCISEDENGDVWFKQVKIGSEPKKFHLISLNPEAESMHDIELKWAAPVKLHWPKDMVKKFN